MTNNWTLAIGFLVVIILLKGIDSLECKDITSCGDCIAQKSMKCGWCALDKRCHEISLGNHLMDNACRWGMSTTDSGECEPKSSFEYDETLSFNQLLLSAVAYTDQTDICVNKINENRDDVDWDYEVDSMISMKCGQYIAPNHECFALVAISHDSKSIFISFRGTNSTYQLVDEIVTSFFSTTRLGNGSAQSYFLSAFQNIFACLKEEIVQLYNKHSDYFVRFSGHSLGGALASIAAFKFAEMKVFPTEKISLYTYGMPRVGDKLFAADHGRKVPNSWRITNYQDCVPHIPPCFLSCSYEGNTYPYHHGVEVFYDDADMNRNTDYTICHGNEDNTCSNKYISGFGRITNLPECVYYSRYHSNYFNISVGSYCDKLANRRRKRSEPSDIYDLLSKDKCSIVKRVDGEWQVTWSPSSSALKVKPIITFNVLLVMYFW